MRSPFMTEVKPSSFWSMVINNLHHDYTKMAGVEEGQEDNLELQGEPVEGEAKKLIESLQFKNPGPQLKSFSEFDPENSARELRKISRLISDTGKGKSGRKAKGDTKPALHDVTGRLVSNNEDLCDCQDVNCAGCHFPCSSCGSEKCGVECRCGRIWTYCKDVMTTDSFILSFNQRMDTKTKAR